MKTVKISKDDLNFLIDKIRYCILPRHIDYDKITNEISKLFSIDNIEDSNSENVEKNLKPFDLEAAKSGKPVCTRSGKSARIICFDVKGAKHPIIALVKEDEYERVCSYMLDGKRFKDEEEWSDDLLMLPEKKEGWVVIRRSDIYENEEQAKETLLNSHTAMMIRKITWEE